MSRRACRLCLSTLALASAWLGLVPAAWTQPCSAIVTLRPLPDSAGTSVPVDIRHAGDGRLFIVELDGRILLYKDGTLRATPFLDLRSKVLYEGERGLLSVAFHPQYPVEPYFFVYYTNEEVAAGGQGDVVIARYSVSADPDVADPDSGRVLLVIPHPVGNHNGGQLHFGPNDGFLYATVGDGGGACDDTGLGCNAQRDDLLLGKMLRLDVGQNENTPPYHGIPPGNPYTGGHPGRDEIWAKGLRNPFRFSFDRLTGGLWIGDVGQDTREEIDFQPAASAGGENYGWRHMEGNLCGTCGTICGGLPEPPCPASFVAPVYDYPRALGATVIGGYVYRGALMPGMAGCYVFGDFISGRVWALDPADPSSPQEKLTGWSSLTSFGEDSAGELYAAVPPNLYRLLPDLIFRDGFE
jgi:glucose/arabinose dehydrogenase